METSPPKSRGSVREKAALIASRRRASAMAKGKNEKKLAQELPKFARQVKSLKAFGATLSELQRIVVATYHQ